MKRFLILGILFLIVAMVAFSGPLWSHAEQTPQTPRSTIALVRLGHVLRSYHKYAQLQRVYEAETKQYQQTFAELTAKLTDLNKEATAPATTPSRREELTGEMKQTKRKLEDLQDSARKVMAEKQVQQVAGLYADLRAATERYAKAHNIEVVLHYNDGPLHMAVPGNSNVSHLSERACIPLYTRDGVDISEELIVALNKSFVQIQSSQEESSASSKE